MKPSKCFIVLMWVDRNIIDYEACLNPTIPQVFVKHKLKEEDSIEYFWDTREDAQKAWDLFKDHPLYSTVRFVDILEVDKHVAKGIKD